MATLAAIARLHRLIWTLVYGGLFAVVLGLSVRRTDESVGWVLIAVGGVVVAIGVALIYVRSRMSKDG